ncbi:MAG: hypothetical protein CMH57_03495 [Myxococcales bacterium]|nr:hypothetical protein [Myxococcales bacterium]
MIKFKDFVPKRIPGTTGGFFSSGEPERYETIQDALEAANNWIVDETIQIVNVETVVLPNIWAEHEEGSEDGSLYTGSTSSHWHQFIRCWYQD